MYTRLPRLPVAIHSEAVTPLPLRVSVPWLGNDWICTDVNAKPAFGSLKWLLKSLAEKLRAVFSLSDLLKLLTVGYCSTACTVIFTAASVVGRVGAVGGSPAKDVGSHVSRIRRVR